MSKLRLPGTVHEIAEPLQTRMIAQSALILDSFERLLQRPLIARTGDPRRDAAALYASPFAVLSHGTEPDPILNYGNRTALELWQTSLEALTALPSRLTAEPMARETRDILMAGVARTGFVTGYSGVRISATGRRFNIGNVTIFNLADPSGTFAGQAAMFDTWSDAPPAAI